MNMDKIQEKLKKIKALAEQGIGGEKEGAIELYQKLLAKYELTDDDIEEITVSRAWFRYDNELDKKLLTQLFYKVTGCPTYYEKTDKRKRLIGVDCTEIERDMIVFYYQFYNEHIQEELKKFLAAFFHTNGLFPDETARCYDEYKDMPGKERSMKEILEIEAMASGMNRKTPNLQIEQRKDD